MPGPLRAERLAADARIARARELVHDALAAHGRALCAVRPADPARAIGCEAALAEFAKLRGGPLFHPYLGSGLGSGPFVELADASVKIDMITGIGVHALGHGHPKLVDALLDAALSGTVMQGNLQQNAESLALCRALVDLACEGGAALQHCFLTTSGAMANENALKLAFHRRPSAERVLAFDGAFAGRTLALAQVTDRPDQRAGLPPALAVDRVPFFDPGDPAGSRARALDALEAQLARHPGAHAAMIFELVQGENGFRPGTADFFAALMERLRACRVAVLVDEIQTFGRTTRPFAFQHFELDRFVDLATVGKLTQVCATLFGSAFAPPRGLVSQTFTGATASILAARVILEELAASGCFGSAGRNARVHARFAERFDAIARRHAGAIRGPYGLGAMIAFTPLDGSPQTVARALRAMFEEGVVAFSAGEDPTRIRFLPPVAVLSEETIDAVCEIVERVLVRLAREPRGEP